MNSFSLRSIDSFGDLAAEDDPVLNYFLTTDSVSEIKKNDKLLVLGRKGAGKTAIVRYFSEGEKGSLSIALNLRAYPWNIHAQRVDRGASEIEAYVSSWRYILAVEIASFVLKNCGHAYHEDKRHLEDFLRDNYGGSDPRLSDILKPQKLKIGKFTVQPAVFGNALGGIELERKAGDLSFGTELNALTDSIIRSASNVFKSQVKKSIYLHFDELDHGIELLDDKRRSMLIGLVLAARDLRRDFKSNNTGISPTIYLRTDIWDDLNFSDKNKIAQTATLLLEWDRDTLFDLIQARLRAKLGPESAWKSIIDDQLMRGSQPKWNHIITRTLRRPRDVIQFLNIGLKVAKKDRIILSFSLIRISLTPELTILTI
jgi:hypothetical protein